MPKPNKIAESTSVIVELDSKDLSILRLLQLNARITVKEISEKVHLSTTPVHETIRYAGRSCQS
jgi:Lrp/AsnC family transcriptional regulator, leucine-responsive regulatory protein